MMNFEEYTWRNHIGEPEPLDPNIDPITGKRIRGRDPDEFNRINLKSNERLLTDEERRILWEQQQRSEEQRARERERERQEHPIEERKEYPPRYAIVYAELLTDYPRDVAHAKIAVWLKEEDEKARKKEIELNGAVQETKSEQKEELPVELPVEVPVEVPVDSSEAEVIFLPDDVVSSSDPDVIKIIGLNRKRQRSVVDAVLSTIEMGYCLIARKRRLNQHGAWLSWLKTVAEFEGFPPFEEARRCMGAARKWGPKLGVNAQYDENGAAILRVDAQFGDGVVVLDEATALEISRQIFGNGSRQKQRKIASPTPKTELDLSVLAPDVQELVEAIINKYEKRDQKREQQFEQRVQEEVKKRMNGHV